MQIKKTIYSTLEGSDKDIEEVVPKRNEKLPELSEEDINRHSLHLTLPEIGVKGQRKLKNARVIIVGAGSLGTTAGMYLATAGIGHLGLIDFEKVEEINLQSQISYTGDAGKSKINSLKDHLHEVNPYIQIETYDTSLTSANALQICREYDIIVDCSDHLPARYLINDVSVLLGKPNVYGAVFRFEGQMCVFRGDKGACYRCLYPEPTQQKTIQLLIGFGIFSVIPGIIGTLQASETIKLILGAEYCLNNKLLLVSAWEIRFFELNLVKNPECPVCGKNPSITGLIDYEAFCNRITPEIEVNNTIPEEITPVEFNLLLKEGRDIQIIDVREPFEYGIAKLPNAKLIPLGQIIERMPEIDPTRSTVIMCKLGIRSEKAINQLKLMNFKGNLTNLKGGIIAWSNEVDPNILKY